MSVIRGPHTSEKTTTIAEKNGQITFKVDKTGIIHTSVGKVSFEKDNADSLIKFSHKFDCNSSSQIYFAYSFPFGYEDV